MFSDFNMLDVYFIILGACMFLSMLLDRAKKEEYPCVLNKSTFVEGWIHDTDIFLNCLLELLELNDERYKNNSRFPRKWNGKEFYSPELIAKQIAQNIKSQVNKNTPEGDK